MGMHTDEEAFTPGEVEGFPFVPCFSEGGRSMRLRGHFCLLVNSRLELRSRC